jgi:copper chaperone CopZ
VTGHGRTTRDDHQRQLRVITVGGLLPPLIRLARQIEMRRLPMCTSEASCGCATAVDTAGSATGTRDGIRTTYTVSGMTCGGCAKSVSRQISMLAGVTGVEVDVADGAVTVTSDAVLETTDVRRAVEQAGYQLVS